ncbi:MAG: hypothetical protein HY908_30275 [Myxococcales bacterium]|nr:hypothetical protein [Myxococcales bacterium]
MTIEPREEPSPAPVRATWTRPRAQALAPEAARDVELPPPATEATTLGGLGWRPGIARASRADFYRSVRYEALEELGYTGRSRWRVPLAERPAVEERLWPLLDAALHAGDDLYDQVLGFWADGLELDLAWSTWAAVLVLGCVRGGAGLAALERGLLRVPREARDHQACAAEALWLAPHPDREPFARALCAAGEPVLRAVGVAALARTERSPASLALHLDDPQPCVATAAARAAVGLDAEAVRERAPRLASGLRHPDADLAFACAVALLGAGDRQPLLDLRAGGCAALGRRAADLVVLAGDADDTATLQRVLGRGSLDAYALDALARFGHPGAWAPLCGALADPELADEAAAALETLFGAAVPVAQRQAPRAWQAAIEARGFAPATRLRRGRVWSAAVGCDECQSDELDVTEVAGRLLELRARGLLRDPVELGALSTELEPVLAGLWPALRKRPAAPDGFG